MVDLPREMLIGEAQREAEMEAVPDIFCSESENV
jgi:hypothetical protein